MNASPISHRVQKLRREYLDLLDELNLRPATRQWVGGLYDRGLRLADELEACFGPLAGKRILEVGSAYAGDLVALHARGADCVASDKFDFAYGRFARAMRDFDSPVEDRASFSIVRCDAFCGWPFADATFDVVMAMDLTEMVEDLDAFFAEIARVLKPGGIALINTGVTLRSLRKDPIYGLPLIAALPNRLRRFAAERIFRRGTDFRLSNHNFNSARKLVPYARRVGYDVKPMKFASSPLMARLARKPFSSLTRWFVRWFAFDFVFLVPSSRARATMASQARAGLAHLAPQPLSAPT